MQEHNIWTCTEITDWAQVQVGIASPAGEATQPFKLPFKDLELENLVLKLSPAKQ